MQGEGSRVIFILPQDREVKWLAWGQVGIWRQRQCRDVLKAPRSWGPSRTHLSSLQKCLGSCSARGTASWQQGSAGFQGKDSKGGVASTGWRWGWAPGHTPACTAGPWNFVQQCNKPNIPCPWIWVTACFQPREISLQQTPHFFGCLPQNQVVGYLCVNSKPVPQGGTGNSC